jgi:hypothetical protein
MAREFFGVLDVDFETVDDVNEETFKKFKRAYDKMVEDVWEMMLYDLAAEHGFEIDCMHPIMENSSYPLQDKEKI